MMSVGTKSRKRHLSTYLSGAFEDFNSDTPMLTLRIDTIEGLIMSHHWRQPRTPSRYREDFDLEHEIMEPVEELAWWIRGFFGATVIVVLALVLR